MIDSKDNRKFFDSKTKSKRETPMKKTKPKLSKSLLLFGIFNLLFGLAMFAGLFQVILQFLLDFNFQLKEGNLLLPMWLNLPIPIQSKFFVYEIKNPQKFIQGHKPHFVERGPYVFNEYRKRELISWSSDYNRIKFNEKYTFEFVAAKSDRSIDTPINMVNMIYTMAFAIARVILEKLYLTFMEPIVANAVHLVFLATHESLIEHRTPRQLLEGRNITLLTLMNMVLKPIKQLGIPVPELKFGQFGVSSNTFGFILLRETTTFGPFEMYTGQNGAPGFNTFSTVYDRSYLQSFDKPPCNLVVGSSDGVFFGRNLQPNQSLVIYNGQICRTLTLQFEKETNLYGIKVFEYRIPDTVFDMRIKSNRCYCSHSDKMKCQGVTDLKKCFDGIPVLLSFPQFYLYPNLQKMVQGFAPSAIRHRSRLYVEPNLGIAVSAQIRMQLNLALRPVKSVSKLRQLPAMVMPLLWLEEGATLEPPLSWLLFVGINGMLHGVYGFLLLAVFGLAQICLYIRKRKALGRLEQQRTSITPKPPPPPLPPKNQMKSTHSEYNQYEANLRMFRNSLKHGTSIATISSPSTRIVAERN